MSGFSSIRMSDNMINATVNAVFDSLGVRNPKGIKSSDAMKDTRVDFDGDGYVTKSELKDALKYDRVALSFKEHKSGNYGENVFRTINAAGLASDVADRMDAADGRKDGLISVGDKYSGKEVFSASSVALSLTTGDAVIGSEIRDRDNAKSKHFTLAEVHQNKDGPKIVMGQ
jgi:hypothetical protein